MAVDTLTSIVAIYFRSRVAIFCLRKVGKGMANRKEKERRRRLVFVIAGSPMENLDFLKSQIAELNPAELVCADGGARHLDKLGLTPHVIIGDMDSLSAGILKRYEEQVTRIVRHPRDKKETDTQLALEYAMASAPDEIRIFGALGGRIDHTHWPISPSSCGARKGTFRQNSLTGGARSLLSLVTRRSRVL